MIVTCSNCQTKFNLPDDKIPAGGAKVKCSKCAHVFKVELPPATPEEEVETLLEKESEAPDTQAGDEFDETFDEVASDDTPEEEAPAEEEPAAEEPAAGEPAAGDAAEEDMPGMDDLFDEVDETPAPDEGPTPSGDADSGEATADDVESLFGDDEGDLFDDAGDEEEADGGGVSDLFDDADDDEDGDDADDDDDDTGDLFADDDDDDDDDDDEYEDDDDLDYEDEPRKGGKSLGCLIILLVFALVIGASLYFKVWTMFGLDMGSYFQNVPYIGKMFMEETAGEEESAATGESPADRVRKIELKNVKQYYVANEKTGNLFVVEGKAVNKFAVPKEQIKVEVVLYDGAQNVLTSQAFLCGNVLSQFQLQVQTQKEIEDGLSSEVGILSNNTFIRPGASTPFMAVFFAPPAGVKEFLVKVVDVGDTE